MESDFSIGVRILYVGHREGLPWNYTDLAAPYWRFYWNLKGQSRITGLQGHGEPSQVLLLDKGYLISPDTDFSCESDGVLDHFFIHFVLDRQPVGVGKGLYELANTDLLAGQVSRLLHLLTKPSDPLARGRLLYHSAGLVLASLSFLDSDENVNLVLDDKVTRAVDFINSNTHRPVSAEELCKASGCGERTLRRLFLASFNVTPLAYAVARRVDSACIHLHFSDASIEEIAAGTGFCDRYHFTRVFTRVRGISPAAFRKIAIEPTSMAGRVRTGLRFQTTP